MEPLPIDTANHDHFIAISTGKKKIITRHNKEYADGFFYKDAKVGDFLKIVGTKTKDYRLAVITNAQYFKNLDELFKSRLADKSFDTVFDTKDMLASEYNKTRPGYSELLERDGIVVWRIRLTKLNAPLAQAD